MSTYKKNDKYECTKSYSINGIPDKLIIKYLLTKYQITMEQCQKEMFENLEKQGVIMDRDCIQCKNECSGNKCYVKRRWVLDYNNYLSKLL